MSMENVEKDLRTMELDLKQLMQASGGICQDPYGTELHDSMSAAKAAGLTFEQWLDMLPDVSIYRDYSAVYEILKLIWEQGL